MTTPRFIVSLAVMMSFGLSLAALVPTASAKLDLYNPKKQYKDEKKTIEDPASRCTGTTFQKITAAAEEQAKKDLAKVTSKDGTVSTGVADAYKIYEKDLAIAWAAMQQPYCGFGAFGATAAKNSLNKTIARARNAFLTTAGKTKNGPGSVSVAIVLTSNPLENVTLEAVAPTSTEAVTSTPVVKSPEKEIEEPSSEKKPEESTSKQLKHKEIRSTLKLGEHSDEVHTLQDILIKKNYLSSDLRTGYFGAMTEKALIAFQKDKKLIATKNSSGAGIVGPKTRRALAE
ncbi:peptidoglycan-binding protein [Patescibacteria group bacterium]|nr:peptidoglycan-binding protein [Patescibacteria group bacterium]